MDIETARSLLQNIVKNLTPDETTALGKAFSNKRVGVFLEGLLRKKISQSANKEERYEDLVMRPSQPRIHHEQMLPDQEDQRHPELMTDEEYGSYMSRAAPPSIRPRRLHPDEEDHRRPEDMTDEEYGSYMSR